MRMHTKVLSIAFVAAGTALLSGCTEAQKSQQDQAAVTSSSSEVQQLQIARAEIANELNAVKADCQKQLKEKDRIIANLKDDIDQLKSAEEGGDAIIVELMADTERLRAENEQLKAELAKLKGGQAESRNQAETQKALDLIKTLEQKAAEEK